MANRTNKVNRIKLAALLGAALMLLGGCTENYLGTPSLSLLSTADSSGHYKPLGPVRSRSECNGNYLFVFGSGAVPSHEVAIAKLLEETGADVLLNARLTRDRVSLLLYSIDCATVKGQPARLVGSAS